MLFCGSCPVLTIKTDEVSCVTWQDDSAWSSQYAQLLYYSYYHSPMYTCAKEYQKIPLHQPTNSPACTHTEINEIL